MFGYLNGKTIFKPLQFIVWSACTYSNCIRTSHSSIENWWELSSEYTHTRTIPENIHSFCSSNRSKSFPRRLHFRFIINNKCTELKKKTSFFGEETEKRNTQSRSAMGSLFTGTPLNNFAIFGSQHKQKLLDFRWCNTVYILAWQKYAFIFKIKIDTGLARDLVRTLVKSSSFSSSSLGEHIFSSIFVSFLFFSSFQINYSRLQVELLNGHILYDIQNVQYLAKFAEEIRNTFEHWNFTAICSLFLTFIWICFRNK